MNKCYLDFRTDMADERVDVYKRVHNLSEIDGIKVESKLENEVTTVTVDVLNEKGSEILKKPIGKYITMELHNIDIILQQILQRNLEYILLYILKYLKY